MSGDVRYGILGSGFVADFYVEGLETVPIARAVANYSRSEDRAERFATRRGITRTYTDMAALCADPEVDMVIIALPNHLHVEAARAAAQAAKGIVCTKPLARNAEEAAEMVRIARDAGVLAGYAETEVFSPNNMKAREMIESGAVGDVLSIRAREAHSGPHADHFWDAELAGGGALLDMGCHTIEAARYFFGKELPVTKVFAWGATMTHADKTTAEDNAIAMLKFANGGISITEASWSAKGGMELRNEIVGTEGRLITDSTATNVWGFIGRPVGYLMEKADAATGFVYPIADEARVYGYSEELRHFAECYLDGTEPRESFVDGYIVNVILDACYRSMKSGRWEPVEPDRGVLGHMYNEEEEHGSQQQQAVRGGAARVRPRRRRRGVWQR
jgi:predicted dehydrogenase